jgi:hypothetical protein
MVALLTFLSLRPLLEKWGFGLGVLGGLSQFFSSKVCHLLPSVSFSYLSLRPLFTTTLDGKIEGVGLTNFSH